MAVGPFRRALQASHRDYGTAVMAVLNATPDSFFDGGCHDGTKSVARVDELARSGAFVIDIGGESTRPGAPSVAPSEQIDRIEAAVKSALGGSDRCSGPWVSVDTSDPIVAEAVLKWGVHVINDVSCLARPELARVVAKAGAALLLMHARGSNEQMSGFSEYPEEGYADVVADVMREWSVARDRAVALGMPADDILFDPGLGFAKNARQSMELLRRIEEAQTLGVPVVVGPSRKSFLGLVEECPPHERLGATVAACLYAADHGVAMVRVHDPRVVRQALLARRTLLHANVNTGTHTDQQYARAVEGGPCSTAS